MNFRVLLLGLALTHHGIGEALSSPLELSATQTPENVSSPTFAVTSIKTRFRYRLRGLETAWSEKPDVMNLVVSFNHKGGGHLDRIAFPVSGASNGWRGSVDDSPYTDRTETIPMPPGAKMVQIEFTSSGSPKSLGIYAIKNLNATITDGAEKTPLLIDGFNPAWDKSYWNQSGTRPSMAIQGPKAPRELSILDSDLENHADWITSPMPASGDSITLSWQEVYNIGAGGDLSVQYDRLPPGEYVFEAQLVDLMGNPVGEISSSEIKIPTPLTQSWWFWLFCLLATALSTYLFIRTLIRRRVQRAVRHTRLIEDERLRIAMDLHDDIGTRLSQISLAGSHAEMKSDDPRSRESFQQITKLTGELAASLSETVWMLSPKNNDLESLIVFLSRIASELSRAGNIRCRIDADLVDEEIKISQEFRHHFVLSVKEALNNALKHSGSSEIRLTIKLNEGNLTVTVADDGSGFDHSEKQSGNGLSSLRKRMQDLKGTISFSKPRSGGTTISMKAPLKQTEY